ncbi:MAG: type III-B CRISPR module-associated protein Cmr3, partial [Candidatus Korarchaeum sp.]|nr:type III-B CRISPR module-associated protein Cmr3 [Candidatus Korarchaeum sp.]
MADKGDELISRMRLVLLEPLDTVFFGDARGMELNLGGVSLRLPLPWTVSGALLSHYLLKGGRAEDLNRGCGEDGDCESEEKGEATVFAFYGPFLSYKGSFWLNAPADLASRGDEVLLIKPRRMEGIESRRGESYADHLPPVCLPLDAKPYVGNLVNHEFLESYAKGILTQPRIIKDEIDFEERRVGIHIDDSKRTVKIGYTFSSIHRRPNFGLKYAVLAAKKEGQDFRFSGVVRLGGEGRAAAVSEGEWKPSWLEGSELESGSTVKVALISPAIYRGSHGNSRVPDLGNLPGKPELIHVKGRPLVIGGRAMMVSGWNMRAK